MNRILSSLIAAALVAAAASCNKNTASTDRYDSLRQELAEIAKNAPAQVGIAVILDNGDTLTVNNSDDYPLMSVFKLHEAVAVCRTLDSMDTDLSRAIDINRDELNPDTWSPMMKDFPSGDLRLQIGTLLDYTLVYSDNNASNILFDHIVSVEKTDSIIRSLNLDGNFRLCHTEREMQARHDLAYDNVASPLSCAALIKAAVTDSLMSPDKQRAIAAMMADCMSAPDRIQKGLAGRENVRLYHRTGSGYTNARGEIVCVNDVAYVMSPDGSGFALAVLVKNYAGEQDEASALIAGIAEKVADAVFGRSE